MKRLFATLSFICTGCFLFVFSQTLTISNLPIIRITTGGTEIPDEPKIDASMGIIYNGEGVLNNVTDPYNHYDGNIGIETRGNSTQGFDKKTYSVELRTATNQDTSVNLLGMGGEEDWILHAMVIDKSQLRIPMSFYFFQQMGHYASETRYVELIIDNDYRGLYALTEKIKRDDDRVDIAKLDSDDIAGDSLTGGYILRIDWLDDPEGFASNYNSQAGIPMFYQWYYPKASNIQPEQAQYMQNWMATFEDALFDPTYTNNQGVRYTDYIDVNSFVDFVLINELSKNSDGYKLSSYVHKDKDSKGGKLVAGPIWDFDQTYGLSTVCSNDDHTGWTYLQNQGGCEDLESMPMWWQKMMEDTLFQNRLICRWTQFRATFLQNDSINNWIDQQTTALSDPLSRNFTKWNDFIGQEIWAEPQPIPQSYTEEITYLKTWISDRLSWMDANLPGNCNNDVLGDVQPTMESFNIYPSPAHSLVSIDGLTSGSIQLIDLNGTILYSIEQATQHETIDVSTIASGVYLIHVEQAGGTQTKRLIVH